MINLSFLYQNKKIRSTVILSIIILLLPIYKLYLSNKISYTNTTNNTNNHKQLIIGNTQRPEIIKINKTRQLTYNLLQPYILMNHNKKELQKNRPKIVQNAVMKSMKIQNKQYTINDIDIIIIPTDDDIEKYKEDMKTALQPLTTIEKYPIFILAEIIDVKDRNEKQKKKQELLDIEQKYSITKQNLLKIRCPLNIMYTHINLINSINKFSVIIDMLSNEDEDPVAVMSAISNINKTEKEMTKESKKINEYLKNIK